MSEAPIDFVLEGERLLVALIHDLCIKKFGDGSVNGVAIKSIVDASGENLPNIYIQLLRGFGNQQTSTGEIYFSFCTTVDINNPNREYNFFEVCVALANIIFNVEGIDEWCKDPSVQYAIQHHFRFGYERNCAFALLCDAIYRPELEKSSFYYLFGKKLPAIILKKLNVKFTEDLDPANRILSQRTIEQLETVNVMIEEARGIEHKALKPTEESPPKLENKNEMTEETIEAREIKHEVQEPTEELPSKSKNKKGWLSHSPSPRERRITNALLIFFCIICPTALFLITLNGMIHVAPIFILPHLDFIANLLVGIAAEIFACIFAVLVIFRIVRSDKDQNELFEYGDKCGPCKAFCFRVIGAHAYERNDLDEHLADQSVEQ